MNDIPRARLDPQPPHARQSPVVGPVVGQVAGQVARPPARPTLPLAMTPALTPDPPGRAKPPRPGPFGVLDIGSSKVCCLIGRVDPGQGLRVIGFGLHASRGVRGGGITGIEDAEFAITKAVGAAEAMAQTHLRAVVVNLTCGAPLSRHLTLQWPVGDRPITEADLRRILQEGRGRAALDGRETIHVLPLAFTVDDTPGVADPRGLHCDNLTARLHTIDAGAAALRNLVTTVQRCHLDIAELVSAPIAAGIATLVDDERQLGATVLDMGGGTTDLAVFNEGHVVHTAQVPVGGSHVTNDIARLLSTPVAHAERLKTLYGNAQGSPDDEREMLPVPLVGEEDHQINRVPRSRVVEIISPRLEETFEMVRDRLREAGLAREPGNRVVLTGGASQLVGVRELAARVLDRQVRLGRPHTTRGLPEPHDGPAFSTAAGLLAWAAGHGRSLADLDSADAPPAGLVRRVVNFLRDRV